MSENTLISPTCAHTMGRLFNAFSVTNLSDIIFDDELGFAFVRPGFAVSLSIIQFMRYLALRQLVVVSMCAVGSCQWQVSSSTL